MTIISVNELVTTCQKIIEVYGYGWGSHTDIAELVCWLELHELNGLERLRQLIVNEALTTYRPVAHSQADDSVTIDGLGQSAIIYALPSLDFTNALFQQQSRINGQSLRVNVINVSDATFFVAAAAHLAIDQPVSITGADNGQHFNAWIRRDSVTFMTIDGTESSSDDANSITLTIADSRETADLPGAGLVRKFNSQRTRADALADGISVDPVLWQSLVTESKRILVPSTEHSRLFGTGGGNAND